MLKLRREGEAMGLREPLGETGDCGFPIALEAMGERWSFMILRAALNGVQHFEEFQSELGIARNILSNRLSNLVANGILARDTLAEDRRKVVYALTEKGLDLLPTMVALRQWGEKWELGVESAVVLVDKDSLQPVRPVKLISHDGRELDIDDLCWLHAEDVQNVATPRVKAVG
jgi:DNA-binding HxlR family transcriptional regulator